MRSDTELLKQEQSMPDALQWLEAPYEPHALAWAQGATARSSGILQPSSSDGDGRWCSEAARGEISSFPRMSAHIAHDADGVRAFDREHAVQDDRTDRRFGASTGISACT